MRKSRMQSAWMILRSTAFTLLLIAISAIPTVAQVTVSLQTGVHAARLDRPERMLLQPARDIAIEGARGEARTFGLRVSAPMSGRWSLDGGLAWSSNKSWQGGFGSVRPKFETQTIISSVAARARLTPAGARWGLTAGAGPAVIFHSGSGTSLLGRNTDVGALLTAGGSVRVHPHLALTLDAQEYLFSSRFSSTYTPMNLADAIQPAGSRFRKEFALLVGVAWRAH